MDSGLERNNFASRDGELMPREQMERAANSSLVSDEALLAVLLKTGAPGLDVIELAHRLIFAFGSLKNLVSSDWRGIEERIGQYNKRHPAQAIRGIGHVKCLELSAAFEIGRRWSRLSPEEIRTLKVETAEDACRVFRTVASPMDEHENVYILLLDANCHPLCEPLLVLRGESSSVAFSTNEIFREAVRWGAHGIIVAHNHPGGNVRPSEEDIELTRRIVAAGEIVSILVLDHIILGLANTNGETYFSLREKCPDIFVTWGWGTDTENSL